MPNSENIEMITQEQIKRGGSKLEITRALTEKGFKYIPSSVFFYSGQNLSSVLPEIQKMLNQGAIILRGSNEADYHGAVDVCPTVKSITTISQLEKAIAYSEEFWKRPDVRRYIEVNDGQIFNPELHFLIQQQSQARLIGQALDHPHQPRIYGSILKRDDLEDNPDPFVHFLGKKIKIYSGLEERSLSFLLENVLGSLRETGVLDTSFAHNYEFCLSCFPERSLLFQARPFKKFEPKKDFVYSVQERIKAVPHLLFLDSLGITAEEGTELPLITKSYSHTEDDDNFGFKNSYAYVPFLPNHTRESSPLSLMLNRMKVFVNTKRRLASSLGHACYRFMKISDLSMFDPNPMNIEGYFPASDFVKLFVGDSPHTYFSDGERGLMVESKYLK